MSELIHLIYVSTATEELSQTALYEIFSQSSLNNQEHEITGLLLYVEGHFLQVLEGTEEEVVALYQTIGKDERHYNSKKVLQEPIEERSFANWGMGFAGVTSQELSLIDGLNDFFDSNMIIHDLDEDKVRKVLLAFKDGRWRDKIK